MLTVRLAPLPPKAILALGTSAGLEELPVTVKLAGAVSTSPIVNAIAPLALSSLIVWLVRLEIVGGSFTGLTATVKVLSALAVPSLTVMVMVVVPDWLRVGVITALRSALLPPK